MVVVTSIFERILSADVRHREKFCPRRMALVFLLIPVDAERAVTG
jgi:hypothetical protein